MFRTVDPSTNNKLKSDNSKRYSRSSTSVSQKVEKKAAKSSRNYTTLNLSGWRRAVGCNNHFKSQLCKGCHSEVFQSQYSFPQWGVKNRIIQGLNIINVQHHLQHKNFLMHLQMRWHTVITSLLQPPVISWTTLLLSQYSMSFDFQYHCNR